jgi:hypothetical protein
VAGDERWKVLEEVRELRRWILGQRTMPSSRDESWFH